MLFRSLQAVSLAQQWERIQAGLPAGWSDARLALAVADSSRFARAAALLGPRQPGRAGGELHLSAARGGAGASPGAVARALDRLDDERIAGELRLLFSADAPPPQEPAWQRSLAGAWDDEVATLPDDWSDVWGEVRLTSSDHLDPAALALAPANPSSIEDATGFRFRCARTFGYGASPGMVRRCLARLDEQGIPGEVGILRSLSDSKPVGTQGPVWYVGGKVV